MDAAQSGAAGASYAGQDYGTQSFEVNNNKNGGNFGGSTNINTSANSAYTSPVNPIDAPSFGWALLAFFFFWVGLILYLIWNKEYPQRAKSILKGLVSGIIVGVVCGIIGTIIMMQYMDRIFDYADQVERFVFMLAAGR